MHVNDSLISSPQSKDPRSYNLNQIFDQFKNNLMVRFDMSRKSSLEIFLFILFHCNAFQKR